MLAALRDRLEPRADLAHPRAGELLNDPPVAKEDQVRPEFHAERSPEGPPRAVLDPDVADCRILPQQARQLRDQGLAMRTPGRAEFQQDRTFRPIDLLAG